MKLLKNNSEISVGLQLIKSNFGPGSLFEKQNGYCVDVDRPIEFRLSESYFKDDPLNPGYLLTPRNFTIPCEYNVNEAETTQTYRYYETKAGHSYGKKGDTIREVYEPFSLILKEGRIVVDLTTGSQKNYAKAFFLLNHPQLGSVFYYYNPSAQASKTLERKRSAAQVISMITDPDYSNYIQIEQLTIIAKKSGNIAGVDGLSESLLRERVLQFAEKNLSKFYELLNDSKEGDLTVLVQEALDYGVIYYDNNMGSFHYTEPKLLGGNSMEYNHKIRLVDKSPFHKLKDYQRNTPAASLGLWLMNEDRNDHSINIRHLLNQEKSRVKAINSTIKGFNVRPEAFSYETLQ